MANYSYYRKLAEDGAGQGAEFVKAADDFSADLQILRYSVAQLEDEKLALENQLAAQKQAFQASIRAAEETAKLEREAGILIGEKRGLEKQNAELLQAKQLIEKLRRAYFLRRMSRKRRLVRLLLPPMLRGWWDRRYIDHLVSIIAHSGQFDKRWYLDTYPDVAQAGIDPIRHYLEIGAPEGRNPNRTFDTTAYLADHPMLSVWGLNPFVAFIVAKEQKEASRPQGAQAKQKPVS
jgi:hypothetical protein